MKGTGSVNVVLQMESFPPEVQHFIQEVEELSSEAAAHLSGLIVEGRPAIWEILFIQEVTAKTPVPFSIKLLFFFLLLAKHEGSLCLRLTEENLERLMPGDTNGFLSRIVLDGIADPSHPSTEAAFLITSSAERSAPVFFDPENSYVYFEKYYRAIKNLERETGKFLFRVSEKEIAKTRLIQIFSEILETSPVRTGISPESPPLELSDRQKIALLNGIRSPFLLVTGGPGTGKTSTVLQILRALVRTGVNPERIRLCAPTGRAARRMTESLRRGIDTLENPSPEDLSLRDMEARTIHRLLRFNPEENDFRHGPGNPLDADYLVVDEVSMVDILLMEKLLGALDPAKTSLCLLGDPNQLPSVEAGAVLTDLNALLLPEGSDPSYSNSTRQLLKECLHISLPESGQTDSSTLHDRIVVLNRGHRSVGPIADLAAKIIAGKLKANDLSVSPPDEIFTESGAGFLPEIEPVSREILQDLVHLWVSRVYGEEYFALARNIQDGTDVASLRRLFSILENGRILSSRRTGPRGVESINRMARAFFSSSPDEPFPGLPIMIQKNDHVRELFNGDTGIVLEDEKGNGIVVFEQGEGFRILGLEGLPHFESAFATTIHKSQGSEFASVLLILPEDPSERLLTREIFYTAVTRAKRSLTIFGSPSVVEAAVNRKNLRITGPFHPCPPEGTRLTS